MIEEGIEEVYGFERIGIVGDSDGGEEVGVGKEERREEGRERLGGRRGGDEGEERECVFGNCERRRR